MTWKLDNFWACAVLRREFGAARCGPLRPVPARSGPFGRIYALDCAGAISPF